MPDAIQIAPRTSTAGGEPEYDGRTNFCTMQEFLKVHFPAGTLIDGGSFP